MMRSLPEFRSSSEIIDADSPAMGRPKRTFLRDRHMGAFQRIPDLASAERCYIFRVTIPFPAERGKRWAESK